MNRNEELNRELSAAEQKRKIRFEQKKKEFEEKGYNSEDLTVGLTNANIMSFVLTVPIIILFAIPFFWLNISEIPEFFGKNLYVELLIFIVSMFVLIVVHELIHGITWSMFTTKKFKSISFGFIAKYMTPYCTCDEPLKKWQYAIGSLMPTVILGIIPTIIAIINGSVLLFAIGAIMIMSGGGDLTVFLKLMTFKTNKNDVLYIDHPYQVGLVVFAK